MGNKRELRKQHGGTQSGTVYTSIMYEHCSHSYMRSSYLCAIERSNTTHVACHTLTCTLAANRESNMLMVYTVDLTIRGALLALFNVRRTAALLEPLVGSLGLTTRADHGSKWHLYSQTLECTDAREMASCSPATVGMNVFKAPTFVRNREVYSTRKTQIRLAPLRAWCDAREATLNVRISERETPISPW